jgi:hypothetical protein
MLFLYFCLSADDLMNSITICIERSFHYHAMIEKKGIDRYIAVLLKSTAATAVAYLFCCCLAILSVASQ